MNAGRALAVRECATCGDDVASACCRVCGRSGLASVLCLGQVPLANEFRLPDLAPSPRYPLHLVLCAGCHLAQLARGVPPEHLFTEYAYFSSASAPLVGHSARLRAFVRERLRPPAGGLVVDIGSNDGYLLKDYAADGHRVLGVDPACNIAAQAQAAGIDTLAAFFDADLATRIRREHGPATLVHANNVLAHVPDILDVLAGLRILLAGGNGAVVVETPYVEDLVTRGLFDTIYHEHIFYYSFTALCRLLAGAGLTVVHVERIDAHGGSLRVVARPEPGPADASVARLLAAEEAAGMGAASYFADFAHRIRRFLDEVRAELTSVVTGGRRLAGFGAPAKAAVMVAATGVRFDCLYDSTPYKQGRTLPGTLVPIVPPGRLLADPPDYCVVLAWNYADAIIAANQEYLRRGGVFVKIVDFRLEFVDSTTLRDTPAGDGEATP